MSFERALQKSAQSNHGLTSIGVHDQNCPDRKLTKTEALFSTERQPSGTRNPISTVQIEDQ